MAVGTTITVAEAHGRARRPDALAVVLGWYGSTQRLLRRHAAVLADNAHVDTVVVAPSLAAASFPLAGRHATRAVAREIARHDARTARPKSLVFLVLSGHGENLFQHLVLEQVCSRPPLSHTRIYTAPAHTHTHSLAHPTGRGTRPETRAWRRARLGAGAGVPGALGTGGDGCGRRTAPARAAAAQPRVPRAAAHAALHGSQRRAHGPPVERRVDTPQQHSDCRTVCGCSGRGVLLWAWACEGTGVRAAAVALSVQ